MRNPLTVHDPDPLDLHFLHEIVPFSCFPAVVLSPHGLPVQHHSLPPLQRPFMQLTGFPTSCIWYMSICNRREERPLCCAKPHIHTNIFKTCHVLKHLYALPSRELTGQRKQEAERPPPLPSNPVHQVSLFPLSATTCPHQTGGRKESLVPSAAAYTETQCFSSLWANCYMHNTPGEISKCINENIS